MTRRRHFERTELATALGESFAGAGPIAFSVGPLERIRFLTQMVRRPVDGRTMLDAAIPAPSGRGSIDRRILADRGWAKPAGPGTRYYSRRFADPDEAFAAIIAAYEAVYGVVGDDRGWTIREDWRPNDSAWDVSRWIGEEAEVVGRSMRPATASSGTDAKQPRRLARIVSPALVGLFCTWATLQSYGLGARSAMDPASAAAILVAEIASAVALSLTDVPEKLGIPMAQFWGGGAVTRAVVAWSVYACGAIASGMALVVLFASRQGGP